MGDDTIVLLHGFPLDSGMWEPQMRDPADRYRLIAPALVGLGASDAPDDPRSYSVEGWADDAIGLIGGLGLDRVTVVGSSLGGDVALAVARRARDLVGALALASVRHEPPLGGLVVVPDAGHLPNLENPAMFNQALVDLAESRLARRPSGKRGWPAAPSGTRTGRETRSDDDFEADPRRQPPATPGGQGRQGPGNRSQQGPSDVRRLSPTPPPTDRRASRGAGRRAQRPTPLGRAEWTPPAPGKRPSRAGVPLTSNGDPHSRPRRRGDGTHSASQGPGEAMRSVPFRNRAHAGRQLAARLADLGLGDDVVVLALPPGGVSVGHEVAVRLDARLEILVARNLCAPRQAELAVGAIAEGDVRVLDERMLEALAVNARELDEITARERRELERWVRLYRGGELPEMAGRSAVLVDDGLAVGMTAEAALQSVRAHAPDRLVLAVPVCSQATAQRLRPLVDDSVCLAMPPELLAVGEWYEDFPHATNAEVLDFLERLRESSVMTRPMLGGSGGDEPTNQRS